MKKDVSLREAILTRLPWCVLLGFNLLPLMVGLCEDELLKTTLAYLPWINGGPLAKIIGFYREKKG